MEHPEFILELAPSVADWNPHDDMYQLQEEYMITFEGGIKLPHKQKFIMSSVINRSIYPVTLSEDVTIRACEVGFRSHKPCAIRTSSGAKSTFTPKYICKICNIVLETARRTFMVTTQLCPRIV